MARSRNMQKLTDQLKARYPGMIIYGIGDRAHQGSPSGHNEDDTPGSKPEQEDPDNKKEHRAIDCMIGKKFTLNDAWNLTADMVQIEANRARLYYVIFFRKIWRRNGGWREERYSGSDPHTNHPHISGNWPDDDNETPWILRGGVPDPAPAPVPTPAAGGRMSNFMIQVEGDPTINLSNGFEWREMSDWGDFLLYRDTFKWPYVVVPDVATFNRRAGRYWTLDDPPKEIPALLNEEQMARIEAAARAGAALSGGVPGSIPADLLRTIMDEEAISMEELRAMASGADGGQA